MKDGNEKQLSLSDKEAALLGLVAEEPSHAYRIQGKIRDREMDQWTEIGFSSIYRVLQGLSKKGLIETHLEDEGQGPTRKVFTPTELGSESLHAALTERLETVGCCSKNPFVLALANILHLPREGVITSLRKRSAKLEELLNSESPLKRKLRELDEVMATQQDEGEGADPVQRSGRLVMTVLHDLFESQIRTEMAFIERAIAFLNEDEPRQLFEHWRAQAEAQGAACSSTEQRGEGQ